MAAGARYKAAQKAEELLEQRKSKAKPGPRVQARQRYAERGGKG
jgi:hypothetical protein